MNQAVPEHNHQGQAVVLDRERFEIAVGVTILGCLLFSQITRSQMEDVRYGLNDFYNIDNWSAQAHNETHVEELTWL